MTYPPKIVLGYQVTDRTTPKFLAWMPFRRDTQVIPADDPDNTWLGFVGYELLGMTVFNSRGVTRVTFTV